MNPTSTIINQIISGTEILGKPSNLSPPMGRAVTLQLEYFLLLPSSCLSAPSDGSDLDPPPSQGLVSELFSSPFYCSLQFFSAREEDKSSQPGTKGSSCQKVSSPCWAGTVCDCCGHGAFQKQRGKAQWQR